MGDAVEALEKCLYSSDDRVRLSAAVTLSKLHLQLDSAALELPTTPAAIADERLRHVRNVELDRILL